MLFTLPKLNYELDKLAPYMSQETLEYHYGKHHQTYINNLNKLLENHTLANSSLNEIVINAYNQETGIFNNAGQHFNHNIFWEIMTPSKNNQLPTKLESLINANFSNFVDFKQQFIQMGATLFGSGWVWLAQDGDKLVIKQYSNATNPLIDHLNPLMGCDVWEHSYYIDYRNNRAEYLEKWFDNLVNWEVVASYLK